MLAGEWVGEYVSPTTGRTGSIMFTLDIGRDTAQGNVLMIPAGSDRPIEPARQDMPDPGRSRAQLLTIAFVQARDGGVSGRLDPYRDPDCGCEVTTVFSGRLVADTLSGTFQSVHRPGGERRTGEWKVVRKK
ncbi:MAG: hypothetical protein AB7I33_05060 [Gemmatimonadales bacterium]